MKNSIAAAEIIASGRLARQPLHPLDADAPADEDEGYRLQDAVAALLTPQLGSRAGYKIGCTNAVMQEYLRIPYPCAGNVFASTVHPDGARLNLADYVRVGVECEIAVRLGRDLDQTRAPFTADAVADSIDAVMPAIEIVDDRYTDWPSFGAPTLIADDFFAAGCVLGKPVSHTAAPELREVAGRAIINGVEAGQGSGADVLGHPHHALAWLANHLAARGRRLLAGEIVLTGSFVKTIWLPRIDSTVTMEFEGIGKVSASFRANV